MRIIQQLVVVVLPAVLAMPAIAQDKSETATLPPIRLHNVADLCPVATIDKDVSQLAFGPGKGQIAMLVGWNPTVEIIDEHTFRPIKQFAAKKEFTGIDVSAHESRIAWCDQIRRVQIIGPQNGHPIDVNTNNIHPSPTFSPDGKWLITGGYGREATLWNAANGKLVRTFNVGPQEGGLTATFSPDGRVVAIGNRNSVTHIFEAATGESVCVFPKESTQELKFSPDGKTLAIAYVNGEVALWRTGDRVPLQTKSTGAKETYTLDWTPDGSILVTAGLHGKITLWDARDLSVVRELDAPEWVIRARFSPDGSRLFTAGGTQLPSPKRKVTVWGVNPGAGK